MRTTLEIMAIGTALTIKMIFFQTGTRKRKLAPTQTAKNRVIIRNPLQALATSSLLFGSES